jgi:hypothetical protein
MKKNTGAIKKDASAMLLAAIFAITALGAIAGFFLVRTATLEDALSGDRIIRTLFVIERDGKPLGTYAFFCYPNTRRGAMFDIPQDIGLIIRSLNRVDRIDRIYDPDHPETYQHEVETLLGITLPYLIVVDMKGLGSLVDLIEGVELNIPEAIADYSVTPPALLPAGRVTLDGDKAQCYVSYISPNDDAEQTRVKRDSFFLSLLKKIGEKQAGFVNPQVRKYFYASIKTTIGTSAIDRLFETLARVDTDRVVAQGIGGNYRSVSSELLLIPYYDGSLVKDIVSEALRGLTRTSDTVSGDRIFTVEVLNGTATAGLAGRTAELFRSFGYDVINVGNADEVGVERTLVIDRSGSAEFGAAFAELIRCQNIRVEASKDSVILDGGSVEVDLGYHADFTLILGGDFNGRYTRQ